MCISAGRVVCIMQGNSAGRVVCIGQGEWCVLVQGEKCVISAGRVVCIRAG